LCRAPASPAVEESNIKETPLPYAGIRVVEFTHMVMGPACGMLLGDLGAEVIKVEPPEGDNTRRLLGSGAGFFPTFNRNKKSIALDLKTPEGREAALPPDRHGRHRQRELQARHHEEARPGLRHAEQAEPAPGARMAAADPALAFGRTQRGRTQRGV